MLIECVPNISEGRDPVVVQAIAEVVRNTPGVWLLHQTSDPDHNRTVFTFAGAPQTVVDAAFLLVRETTRLIHLPAHSGVHPRVGAADVVPMVPIAGITMQQTAELARELGRRVWSELRVPVFLYEAAALREQYRQLEQLRKFVPQGLPPDYGDRVHPTAGAVCIGARQFLIAWNVNLQTADLSAAKQIAREIRQSNGGLRGVKALGMPLASRGIVQVSMNVVDFEQAPLHVIFHAIAEKCRSRGIAIAGSELIGLIPEAALQASQGHDLQWENLTDDSILENRLRSVAAS